MKRDGHNGQLDIFNHEHCATSTLCIFMKSVAGRGAVVEVMQEIERGYLNGIMEAKWAQPVVTLGLVGSIPRITFISSYFPPQAPASPFFGVDSCSC